MAELFTSEEICEALVRHVEVSGSEVFEKNFDRFVSKRSGNYVENVPETRCTVWCVIGPNAEAFKRMARKWLEENGFKLDGEL